MAQSDAYAEIGEDGTYTLDLPAPLLDDLATRVVNPLLPQETTPAIRALNPVVEIGDRSFVLITEKLAAIPRSLLRQPVASLTHRRDDITRALDTLFTGF